MGNYFPKMYRGCSPCASSTSPWGRSLFISCINGLDATEVSVSIGVLGMGWLTCGSIEDEVSMNNTVRCMTRTRIFHVGHYSANWLSVTLSDIWGKLLLASADNISAEVELLAVVWDVRESVL